MGLAAQNYTKEAFTEFTRNSFDFQTQIYPEQWLGQWTRSDTVDGAGSWGHEGMPGNWTWSCEYITTERPASPPSSDRARIARHHRQNVRVCQCARDAVPALCTHSHAWPLVSFPFLAGLRFTPTGLDIVPTLPRELGAYSYESPLASIAFDGSRRFTGHWAAAAPVGEELILRYDLAAVADTWRVEREETVEDGRVEFVVTIE
jgi:hypothetical protein